ncbi:TetR/AcrR family transcriptional regulator [Marinomonas transparens]|uniref:TetR/AcrR family transcriptional regulator n=1 Tax=Marinomonas transparens TaxID=2795388 RepID=A0A934N1S1_9GAMM|nr:TetR/AcrR family transcriptional regulator [Marinomonas transparens]MBJ7538042.1 TetR/AcrR family transcriptional regulator [Marinomonas transparens]
MARDRKETEQRLVEAAGRVLARDGFKKLGVNAIAREANLDKVLIYRYFDGLSGLIDAYARQGDFWPSTEELLGEDLAEFKQRSLSDQLSQIVDNYAAGIRRRPLTLQILAWEMVERNELTMHLEKVREKSGAKLFEWVWYDDKATADSQIDIEALMTLFSACTNYLAARSTSIRVFNGIDISEEDGWQRLTNMMKKICHSLL